MNIDIKNCPFCNSEMKRILSDIDNYFILHCEECYKIYIRIRDNSITYLRYNIKYMKYLYIFHSVDGHKTYIKDIRMDDIKIFSVKDKILPKSLDIIDLGKTMDRLLNLSVYS